MEKLKIAVLDSGFDNYRILKNKITLTSNFLEKPYFIDQNGHGTCILSLLDSIGDNLEFYNMVILNKNKSGTILALKNALREAIRHGVHIINISLGLEKKIIDFELKGILEECRHKKIILVTTESNLGIKNYLLDYGNFFCIMGRRKEKRYEHRYHCNSRMFVVDNIPRILPWLNGTYVLSGANSFLTPFLIEKIYWLYNSGYNINECYDILFNDNSRNIIEFPTVFSKMEREIPKDIYFFQKVHKAVSFSNLYNNVGELIIKNVTRTEITKLVYTVENILESSYKLNSLWLPEMMYIENLSNKLFLLRGERCE